MTNIKTLLSFCQDQGCEVFENNSNPDQLIYSPRQISDAQPNQFTFISSKLKDNYSDLIEGCKAGFLIIERALFESFKKTLPKNKTAYVITDDPKKITNECIKAFFIKNEFETDIHPSAVIDPTVQIPKKIKIGPNVIIEKNVKLGEKCVIGANSVLHYNSIVGNNAIIKSNSVIGGTGFGYVLNNETKEYEQIRHFGKVIIKDNVHIGSCTCIDRGSLSDTIIEDNVRIDNLVHIAHNVHIGKNSMVIACSMIAGSVKIGENCWVAPSASIRNGISIGDNSTVGLGSVVTGSVKDNKVVLGAPAVDMETFKRIRKHQNSIINKQE